MSHRAAFLVEASANAKIAGRSKVAATYASIASTCPTSCPLRGEGCYAQNGHVGMQSRKLDAETVSTTEAARQEARAIACAFSGNAIPQDGARGGRDLRLHVSGDCRANLAASIIGRACARWAARGGGSVWTYTHAWRDVLRASWGSAVSVLASCERTADGRAALRAGYAPAVVVPELPADGRAFERDGLRWIPCPSQTRDVACTDCRLCFDDAGLRARKSGIAFAAHGARTSAVKRRLLVLQ